MSADADTYGFDVVLDRRCVPALKTHEMVLGQGGEKLFAAGVADMDFAAPPQVLEAMKNRLEHGVFGYEAVPDGLFSALIDWQKSRHQWEIDPAQILRAPNILNSLAIAVSLFTRPGEGVIVQPPVFFDFFDIIHENHRAMVSNPLKRANGRYTIDFEHLETLAADQKNKVLFLCNPHNPVGRVWSREELLELGDICQRHGVLVVSDEIHADITFSGHRYTPYATLGNAYADNAIICISPAKSFNIAACCSAFTIIANAKMRNEFQVENSRLTVNKNNAFSSVAMEAAYKSGGPWLASVLEYLEGNVALVRKCLAAIPDIDLVEPEGTFLCWLDFRALNYSPGNLTKFLRDEAGWAVTRGQAFGREGEGFARLNIACPKRVLTNALEQLTNAMINKQSD